MPHAKIKLLPGINTTETPALNEAGISQSTLIRFVPDGSNGGLIQKLGGWTQYPSTSTNPLGATIRALWAWEDTNALKYLAAGTQYQNSNLQSILAVYRNGTPINITPQTKITNPAVNFTTYSGTSQPLNQVKIIDTGNGPSNNLTSVFIGTQITIGGLVLFGLYPVTPVDSNSYYIYATDVLGNPQNATSAVSNAGAVATFTTASASSSVTVTLANHGLLVGSTYPIVVPVTIGGIKLYGNYIVQTVTSTSVFTILAANQATSTAGPTSQNGGLANLTYNIAQTATIAYTGYGAGNYNAGLYGSGLPITTSVGTPISTTDWTLDNWGENLIATPVPYSATVLTVASYSGNGTTATLNLASSYSYKVPIGATIIVSGLVPSGYNGTYIVTGSTSSTVQYANTTTGSGSAVTWYNSLGTTLSWTNSSSAVIGWQSSGSASGTIVVSGANTGNSYSPIYQWSPTSNLPIATALAYGPVINDGAFVAMPQRQIVAWGSTFNGIQDPLLIRWCDINNYYSWIASPVNQAGSFRIPKGSRIVACIQGPQQGLVWTDLGLWSMQYISQPLIYSFTEIGTGCGLIARKAATSMNGVVYWMGQSQFYRLSGSGVEIIPCPVWDVVFQNLNTSDQNLSKIRIAPNSRFGEITWYYPSNSSSNSAGEIDSYVKYNVILNVWDYGSLSRTAWINESVLGPPIGASGDDQLIYQHETSNDAGTVAMNSSFTTGYFAVSDGDQQMFIDEIWPDMKWGDYGSTQSATVSITFTVLNTPTSAPQTYGPYNMSSGFNFLNPRMRGRLVSVTLSSSDAGSFWRIGNIRYRYQPDGRY